jgi:hypothetical protein
LTIATTGGFDISSLRDGQRQLHGRPEIALTCDRNRTAIELDISLGDRQSQAGAGRLRAVGSMPTPVSDTRIWTTESTARATIVSAPAAGIA